MNTTRALEKSRCLSGSTLKLIAVASMFVDHTAAAVLGRLMNSGWSRYQNWDETLYSVYFFMRMVGRIAFPIFCFLLVEGFFSTHDKRRYAMRLGLFALISEIPFDLAFEGKILEFTAQNVFFTLLLGLLSMLAVDRLRNLGAWPAWLRMLSCGAAAAGCAVLASLLHTDYGALGVACILVLFVLHGRRIPQAVAGALSFSWEPPAMLAFIPIFLYSGKRGLKLKYFFYIFYPAHLLLLYLVCTLAGIGNFSAM